MTKLPTLSSYLYAMQSLLAFILRIPPVDSSTPLHTTFLLRLVPVILILKGNLEMHLSARLGKAANMGHLDDPRNRRNIICVSMALGSIVPDPPTSTAPISFGGEATNSTTLLSLAPRPLPMDPGQPRSLSLPRFIMVTPSAVMSVCLSSVLLGPHDSMVVPSVKLSHEAYQNYVHDAFAPNGGDTTDGRAIKKQKGATLKTVTYYVLDKGSKHSSCEGGGTSQSTEGLLSSLIPSCRLVGGIGQVHPELRVQRANHDCSKTACY
ncbi:hypothetical protein EDD16DRAFT_1665533 [Pisolithus croceorrhizus]|nr:hypothetical protein EDD16DRAFT_1665533 [Pisolithus croceorrhizus]